MRVVVGEAKWSEELGMEVEGVQLGCKVWTWGEGRG